jgi:type II restriction/modification system DNA methylase subunit YeeA
VDFGVDMPMSKAALYEAPFEYVRSVVKPERDATRREKYRNLWWLFAEPIPGLRNAIATIDRYAATVAVAKHRVWAWIPSSVLPDHALMVVARDDDTTFGVLHSRFHEIWSLRMGTSLEDRPRYTPTSCFETFPFPEGLTPNVPAAAYARDERSVRIALAARTLTEFRDRWLNPPEWTERAPEVEPLFPERVVVKAGHEEDLKKRTLTNLYNVRPPWLSSLHSDLDAAVSAAYGWEWPLSDEKILSGLFELNQQRSGSRASDSMPRPHT